MTYAKYIWPWITDSIMKWQHVILSASPRAQQHVSVSDIGKKSKYYFFIWKDHFTGTFFHVIITARRVIPNLFKTDYNSSFISLVVRHCHMWLVKYTHEASCYYTYGTYQRVHCLVASYLGTQMTLDINLRHSCMETSHISNKCYELSC